MNPSSAKNAIATEPLAAVNRGLRNRLMSIIGLAVARSAATSRASMARPAARVPTPKQATTPPTCSGSRPRAVR